MFYWLLSALRIKPRLLTVASSAVLQGPAPACTCFLSPCFPVPPSFPLRLASQLFLELASHFVPQDLCTCPLHSVTDYRPQQEFHLLRKAIPVLISKGSIPSNASSPFYFLTLSLAKVSLFIMEEVPSTLPVLRSLLGPPSPGTPQVLSRYLWSKPTGQLVYHCKSSWPAATTELSNEQLPAGTTKSALPPTPHQC